MRKKIAREEAGVEVKDRGSLHHYRTEIPNMVDDMDLSVYAFRLYVRLKRVAGDNGKCWESTRTLAERCNMSVSKISDGKQELVTKKLIEVEKRDNNLTDVITLVDLWPQNFEKYASSPRPASPVETSSSALPGGVVPDGVNLALPSGVNIAELLTNLATALQNEHSQKDESVRNVESQALLSTIKSLLPTEGAQGFTTLPSSAATAIAPSMQPDEGCSPGEQGVRGANTLFAIKTPRSPDEKGVRHSAHKKNQLRTTNEKEPMMKEEEGIVGAAPTAPAAPPTAWDELVDELCTTCYGHTQREVLTESSRGALLKEAKIIREAGFGVRDLPRWFDQVWRKDFRWVKNKQLPKPYEVRESLPRLARAGDYAVGLPPLDEVPQTAVAEVSPDTPSVATVPAGDDWSTALADMRVQIPDLVDGPLAGSCLQAGGMFMGRPLWYIVLQGDDDAVYLQRRAKALIERTLSVQLRTAVYVEIVPARVFASTGEQA